MLLVAGGGIVLIMSPEEFASRCAEITGVMRGHAAHRALDLLTNDVLRMLGYGRGVDIFEAAVAQWHDEAHPYPHIGPCPDCEAAISPLNDRDGWPRDIRASNVKASNVKECVSA